MTLVSGLPNIVRYLRKQVVLDRFGLRESLRGVTLDCQVFEKAGVRVGWF